jgi:AhpC/TSA family
MNILFMLSYALLGGLVVLQAIILNWILRETLRYRRLYLSRLDKTKELIRNEALNRLPKGAAAPEFTAPLLSTGELINTSHIKGHDSILLFVAPDKPSPYHQHLPNVTHALWHETDGHLYIICNGREESCKTFVNEHLVEGLPRHTIPVILDDEGSIARSFLVKEFPIAVSLDEDLRVFRYGEPVPGEEAEPEADRPQTDPDLSEPAVNDRPCDWPDSHPTTGATFARVDTKVSCVLTRFRLRSAWSLLPFYLAFRRIRRESREIGGLLQSLFLIEDWRTCYTLSMWANDCAIVDFGRVRAHIDAANSAFGPTYRRDMQRSEIWSAQFRLWAVSSHNMNWDGFDLQPILGDQWERRESAPLKEYLLQPRMNANIHE